MKLIIRSRSYQGRKKMWKKKLYLSADSTLTKNLPVRCLTLLQVVSDLRLGGIICVSLEDFF